ncbi:hypothetical protein K491DRAFT_692513 [Lophiostoma macrostomum CBS 122681]|uniref:Uncharacterized protein n=1 Tax=Lophiostoma macrostomum CBS 122681 TaxID=1314788 RepID=A0A6A6T999_9PLEO|nr:hypothetical protein K491DRAFT_692513 [Lophiostoma macrostomum CBS 122681]
MPLRKQSIIEVASSIELVLLCTLTQFQDPSANLFPSPFRPLRDMTVSHFSRLLPDMTLKEANRLLEERYPKLGARPLMYQHHPMFPLTANRYMPHIIALPDDIFLRDKLDNSKLRICDVVATLLYQLDCQNPNILDCFYGSIQDKECGMVQGLGATLKRKEVGGRKPPHLLIHRNKNQVLVRLKSTILYSCESSSDM